MLYNSLLVMHRKKFNKLLDYLFWNSLGVNVEWRVIVVIVIYSFKLAIIVIEGEQCHSSKINTTSISTKYFHW